MKKISIIMSLLFGVMAATQNAHAKNPYPVVGQCDGLPKVDVKTIAGTCVGVVASDLKMPRGVLPLSDDEVWVTEMGSWERNHGRLSRLSKQADGRYSRTTLLEGLDRPHVIVLGPDGWVYIGEAGRVIRINPKAAAGQTVAQTVLSNLPDDGHHPLKQMLFDANGNLYLSMGSKTDHCEGKDGAAPSFPCKEAQGERATASIWKVTAFNPQPRMQVYARGLRNAMGMVWTTNNELLVTENSRDNISQADKKLKDANLPHDELDIVKQGGDYGWPYCYDNNRLIPEYRGSKASCQLKLKPQTLLPAHSAPLGITLYPNSGEIKALRGDYLIALHGYRDTGHRVIAYAKDAAGLPVGKSIEVIAGWDATDNQPMGAPVELRVSPSGKVYVTDDRNDELLRLSPSR